MNLPLPDILSLVVYFVLLGVFGYLTRRTRTFEEFSVGNRAIPSLMVFASLAATIVGPGFSVGFTAKGYDTGFLFYYLCLGYGVQTVLTGWFVAPRLSEFKDCTTLGDVMLARFGPVARILTGLVSVGLLVGFTAVMGKVGGGMLHAITGWPMPACLLVVTGSTALLTFTGGLRATVATEALQFTVFSVIIPFMMVIAWFRKPDLGTLMAEQASLLTAKGISGMSTVAMLGVAASFLCGEMLLPPYANRALAAKSPGASRTGFVLAGIYTWMWLGIVAALGILGRVLLPPGIAGDDVTISLARLLLPAGMFGALLAAILAIVMSSQESVLNSGAVAFVRDVLGAFPRFPARLSLMIAKTATLVLAAVSIFLAQNAPSIIDGLLLLYSIWAPTVVVPLLAAIFTRLPPLSGVLAIIAGGTTSVVWQAVLSEPQGIPAILVGLGASLLGLGLGQVISSFQPKS